MTQKIFDTDNAEDMALLWSILPEGINRISSTTNEYNTLWSKSGIDYANIRAGIILINWHDKTEITRPIQEASEADIGKLCKFWDYGDEDVIIGKLTVIERNKERQCYRLGGFAVFDHARRLTKQEIEELC